LEAGPGVGNPAYYTYLPVGWDGTNNASTGVWLKAKQGISLNADCTGALPQAGAEHWHTLLPVYDRDNGAAGSALKYHVIGLIEFTVNAVPTCSGGNVAITGTIGGYGW